MFQYRQILNLLLFNVVMLSALRAQPPVLVTIKSDQIKIKYHAPINPSTANATNLKIWGDETGQRTGTYTTSVDTVIFTPATPFRAGELLHITSRSGLQFTGGNPTTPFSWVRPSPISNPTAVVFDSIGTGIILPASVYGSNAGYQSTMADVNRDGRQDLIYRYNISSGATNIRVYIRDANGSFATPVTYTNPESYSTLIGTPDLNNDGYPDLVITHNVPARIQVRLNNGTGGFGAATLYVVNDYTSSANVYDLDQDGDLDIVVYSGNSDPDQNAINVLKNNGNGTFASATTLTTGVAYSGGIPADINNDGIFELLYTSDPYVTNNPVFRVYTNDGNANFAQYSSEPNPGVKSIRSAFDFDGNQAPDIITRNPNAEIHLGNSGLTYTLNTPTVLDAQDSWMLTGDIDGDGDLDIMSTNRYNGSNWNTLPMKIYLNNGNGTFVTTTSAMVLPQIFPIDLTDYDSDGDLDHIYLNRATGEIKVLLNNCSIVRTLTLSDSPLSGTYQAAETINVVGNVSVSPNENVLLKAPLVKVSDQFNPGNLSHVTISPDGCNTPPPFICGTSTVTFTYNGSPVTYGTVVSVGGKCWLDRNLGASQVATSSTDAAAYGDLFQWGRGADGHQIRTSGTTTTLSSTDSPGHGLFIIGEDYPHDWRSPQNDNLWLGVSGINNPCPTGFRVPMESELNNERLSWSSNNSLGAFLSPLKLPLSGFRHLVNGSVTTAGERGYYWSSNINDVSSFALYFISNNAYIFVPQRMLGYSLRCIKDENSPPSGTITTLNCAGATNNGTLTSGTSASGVSSVVPYTGGNGGTHSGQTVTSTGVTGLTATLTAGTFASGSGSLTYTITGTPATAGTASFALSIGGQSCTLTRTVNLPVGTIATLNCAGATNNGTLTSGTSASGVSSVVPYTGGNGGTHSEQTVTSTGVTGLTATLAAGSFVSGSGSLTYTITGTPASVGTASFGLNIGGQSCSLSVTVGSGGFTCGTSTVTFTYNGSPVTYGTVVSAGRCWLDRNLGASQVATSSTDAAAYGDLFQWGRGADGHQRRNPLSGTTSTLSSTDSPGHGFFIKTNSGNLDWRSPQNHNLWQGVTGINNPCPFGYRLPTINELNTERICWSSNNATGAFASPLKLPVAGYRHFSSGYIDNEGSIGRYWSETTFISGIVGSYSEPLVFDANNAASGIHVRGFGYSLRCIKEEVIPAGIIGSLNCEAATNIGTLTSEISASGVSSTIPFTGSNGGMHSGQIVSSTGVTGLTATLTSGSFLECLPSLTYIITGTPASAGTALFALNIGGQACSLSMVVNTFGAFPEGTVHCNPGNPTAVVGVTNPLTGRTWMDRNLGAEHVASSSTDAASYGDLYQWGRMADGHQCRNSATTIIVSSVDQPTHGDFILNGSNLFDWRSPQNTNLWQGIYGVNNPCPYGYRLPTDAELNAERLSWGNNNSAGALSSILKMPLAGYRNKSDGLLTSVGDFGTYWSSTINTTNSRGLFFDTNTAALFIDNRANGASVRCLIDAIVGSIGSLNCQNATIIIGTLISGVPAIDVSAEVPYTSGNGYSHSGQTVTSTGVTGLSATIAAGSFANGSGSLTYTITGIPTSAGAASFALNIGGQNCTLTVTVADLPYPSGTIHCNPSNPTFIIEVLNPLTGKTWMDRNLGANQVATSSTDTESYGDVYQWGRRADGHQCRTSPTTTILSSTDQPSHGDFIIISSGFEDWRSPQNTNLWQGVNGINNPCPAGFRVPTSSELDIERLSWSNNNAAGAFASPLKLPKAGYRNFNTGSFGGVGSVGGYWSSTVNSQYSHDLEFVNGSASNYSIPRAFGLSIRCTKDEIVPEASVGSLNCAGATITGTLTSGVAASGVSAVVPYTGGNGGFHTGQILTSTGVTGLTATLALGQIANGSGSLAYSITGTPASAGTALFALNIGGQSCSLSATIAPGSIGSLNCAGATITGTLISGVAASGVSRLVPYTGGNGGTHNGQMVTSTGVTGLTANLLSGLFVSGSGSLTYTITGTPASAGTALFALNIGGQSCSLSVTIAPGSIGSLNCASTNITGILISGLAASGASAAVTYTGGNGGAHSGQTVTSAGVIGLTATLTSGNFASGSGSLTYTITGTPSSTGTAAFALNIGGQSCMISVSVLSGSIESLICAGATISGTLISGVSASGVSASVPYTGGNGGNQSGQTVSSTGVTGLTAMLTAGSFALGSGSATYTITGTPLSAGTASFLLSIGGQSCSLSVPVTPGSIVSLNCSGATIIGTLTSSFGASNVSATVPYMGGNGGSHSGQTVPSMGVYGLTAKLTALFFASGSGSLTYTITGTPTSAGTAVFGLNIGGQSCNLSLTVGSGAFTCGTSSVSFTYNGSPVTYGTVVSSGKCWLDRNLGASQVATSSTDALAYGDLFQWGRGVDGHQIRSPLSGTITTLSSTDIPGHDKFIRINSGFNDWRSPQNNNLWQLLYGTTNPCPTGFRIPNTSEFNTERTSWSSNNALGAFNSPLKLPLAGARRHDTGALLNVGSSGIYWSKNFNFGSSQGMYFTNSEANSGNYNRAYGFSVRCIKDENPNGSIGALDCNGATLSGRAFSGLPTNGITAIINYSLGDGGSYSGQSLTSIGVFGLIASLEPNTFSNGSGSLTYTISGTPLSPGIATFMIIIGGQTCSINVNVGTCGAPETFSYNGNLVTYGTVVSGGRCWLDRNLGASQVATSSMDALAYGDLFQWGRGADGHQRRNPLSGTTPTSSSTDSPGHGNFITTTSGNYDWRSPQNENLWQGTNGINNPCPEGFRLPTTIEFEVEQLSWNSNNAIGAYASPLKLPVNGYREGTDGSVYYDNSIGLYWSSSVDGSYSRCLYFDSGYSYLDYFYRSNGLSVRCIKD